LVLVFGAGGSYSTFMPVVEAAVLAEAISR